MADVLRYVAALLLVSAVTWADCHQARAQTNGPDRRQGSSGLLDAVRSAELSRALADEEKSKTDPANLPRVGMAFPMPSCLFPGGLCGALNRDGSVAVAPRYDWVDKFYEGRALVRSNGLYGYIDAAGRAIAEPRYETAGAYSIQAVSPKSASEECLHWLIPKAVWCSSHNLRGRILILPMCFG
jgi:hypothetical protein